MKIISASERLKEQTGVKMVIFGRYGIGKTSLLKTLDEDTLCLDFEAGMLAVKDWDGDSITLRTWEEACDIALLIGGVNPSAKGTYSKAHYDAIKDKYKDIKPDKYKCIFIDSITFASKLCFSWCKTRPESFSEKTGKPDIRSAYNLLGSEMTAWLNQFQHIPNKDVVFLGLLEQKTDELNRLFWAPQLDGIRTASEIPGILDEVISMVSIKDASGNLVRKFVCTTLNAGGYPAKDRSGKLSEIEEAHLGNLLKKIKKCDASSNSSKN